MSIAASAGAYRNATSAWLPDCDWISARAGLNWSIADLVQHSLPNRWHSRASDLNSPNHLVDPVADRPVTTDQIRVHVAEQNLRTRQAARVQQVEEDGAASHERLDVARECRG